MNNQNNKPKETKIADLPMFFVYAPKRGSFFAYGEPQAIHYAKMFRGVHIPFELVKEQAETLPIGRFILPEAKFCIN